MRKPAVASAAIRPIPTMCRRTLNSVGASSARACTRHQRGVSWSGGKNLTCEPCRNCVICLDSRFLLPFSSRELVDLRFYAPFFSSFTCFSFSNFTTTILVRKFLKSRRRPSGTLKLSALCVLLLLGKSLDFIVVWSILTGETF
jgi:hypothetical protein